MTFNERRDPGRTRRERIESAEEREGYIMSRDTGLAYKFFIRYTQPLPTEPLFHLIDQDLGEQVVLEPRVPPGDADYRIDDIPDGMMLEEILESNHLRSLYPGTLPSVSFAPSPEQCLLAIAGYKNMSSGTFYVYGVAKALTQANKPSAAVVDAHETGELRSGQSEHVRRLGTLEFHAVSATEAQEHLPKYKSTGVGILSQAIAHHYGIPEMAGKAVTFERSRDGKYARNVHCNGEYIGPSMPLGKEGLLEQEELD